ncbi:hypothetical protein [Maricaulis maris]|jgi:hypothetical protein|uniref:hypothetical protein n=1 Tax=Maricaulis maris TaxID=74318 RepID=UPI00291F6462|nr:hypothetical protein MACH15_18300 [Maricaulis maris]
MSSNLGLRDVLHAALVCATICLALLAIKFAMFGWLGAGAAILFMVALCSSRRRRLRWRLILPATILGAVGYSVASATVAGVIL